VYCHGRFPGTMSPAELQRNEVLLLPDAELLRRCRVDTFRGSGRGGQKRNVTDSAVRVTHVATGVTAASDRTRSQIQNRSAALRMLRKQLALQWRSAAQAGWEWTPPPPRRQPEYAVWLATVLDVLAEAGWRVGQAADRCGIPTARFVKPLGDDLPAWRYVAACRGKAGMGPLRPPDKGRRSH